MLSLDVFELIDRLLVDFKSINSFSYGVVLLATLVGLFVLQVHAIKLLMVTIRGLRLYVFSQLCCPTDTLSRYGEWVVVTGATDGIGREMALEFARRGHSVVVIGRSYEKLARTKAVLEEEAVGHIETIQIDLSDSSMENYERIRAQLDADNRDIGILVNNAGVGTEKFLRYADCDLDSLRCAVNVNVLATTYFTRMIMPGMLARKRGLILNVSSLAAETSLVFTGVYKATKAFVSAFSRTLQIEYATSRYPVDIINLTTGFTRTNMLHSMFPNGGVPNLFVVSADSYAKSVVNAIGTRVASFSGCLRHALVNSTLIFFDGIAYPLGLIPLVYKIYFKLLSREQPPPN